LLITPCVLPIRLTPLSSQIADVLGKRHGNRQWWQRVFCGNAHPHALRALLGRRSRQPDMVEVPKLAGGARSSTLQVAALIWGELTVHKVTCFPCAQALPEDAANRLLELLLQRGNVSRGYHLDAFKHCVTVVRILPPHSLQVDDTWLNTVQELRFGVLELLI
jgi:hypothetical protein